MKSPVKNQLTITKKEWNGMVVLIVLIIFILAAPYAYKLIRKDTVINFKEFNRAVAQLEKAKKSPPADYPVVPTGGRTKTAVFYKKIGPGVVIELNTADSTTLTGLPGVGGAFAKRILSYRQRLGGFCRKEQLKEVFGLDSTTCAGILPHVKADAAIIKKININTVTFEELSRFPYLSYKQMNAVVRFREEHGDYESVDDLGNIAIIDAPTLRKIKPYLKIK